MPEKFNDRGGLVMTRAITAKERQFYEENGYLVLRQWLTSGEVSEINREFQRLWMDLIREGAIRQPEDASLPGLFPRLRDYHHSRARIAELVLSERMFAAAEPLIAEPALAISTSYYFKAPGAFGLPMHQDNHSVGAAPVSTCSLWTSLSSSHVRNGGVFVVPASHRLGLLQPEPIEDMAGEYGEKLHVPPGYEQLALDAGLGDVIAFHGNLLHGSYANVTQHEFRQAHVAHFTGVSVEKVSINHQHLVDRSGAKVRRRLNMKPRLPNQTLKQTTWSGVGGKNPWK